MAVMKLFLAIAAFLITVSVACTASRSVGSQSFANTNSAVVQTPAQPTNASGQDKPTCQLTLVGAPDIKGLRLGMTAEDALAMFPGIREDAEVMADLSRPRPFGTSSFLVRPDRYQSKEKFAGIKQVSFMLLDARVSNITVGYNGPEHSHVDKFVAKITEGTSLPAVEQWEPYVGMDNSLKVLKCAEFEINVFVGGPGGNLNYVRMKDLDAEKKLKDRRDKARAKETPPGQ